MILAQMTTSAEQAEQAEAEAVLQADKGDDVALRYVKSYHLIRTFVGGLGFALPFILAIGWRLLRGEWDWQGSLSAYYHTGVRDGFVGILGVVGILLWTYKVGTRKVDNQLSTFAGIMAIGVALIPTGVPENSGATPTTLQQRMDAFGIRQWERLQLDRLPTWLHTDAGLSQIIHFTFAILFISSLIIICLFFARAEMNPDLERFNNSRGRRDPRFWYWVHRAAAAVIFAAAIGIVITQAFSFWEKYSILIGEAVAIWAFGISWFVKGLDAKVLWAGINPSDGQAVIRNTAPLSTNPVRHALVDDQP